MSMSYKGAVALGVTMLALTACTTIRETQPTQTAREQLLMSTAADLASAKIVPNVPQGNAIFVDSSNFMNDSEYHTQYAIARIRGQLLSDGYRLVDTRSQADTVAEISAGALSINQTDKLFGVPSVPLPIPFTGTVKTPEIAVYKKFQRTGVAKFYVSFFNAQSGALQDIVGPTYGFSHFDRSTLLGIGWKNSNILPPEAQDEMDGKTEPETAN